MRCLWLTLGDPEPAHNGQFVYTGGLIEAVAQAGAEVDVLGFSRPESRRRDGAREGRVNWHLAEHRPLSHWASLHSHLPNIANRCRTPAMCRVLEGLLANRGWDAIIFDGLSAGWSLRRVLRQYARSRRRPKLVYISHNHEESLRLELAANQPRFLKRQVLRVDGYKVKQLERALVRSADLVTAITPEDGARYGKQWADKRIEVLTPGYRGRSLAHRRITDNLPRRAVIVGSFDWIAKRMNLEEFVDVADPIFAARGVELQVIGSGEEPFFDQLRKRVSATEFTGTVDSVTDYMDEARAAIVPERNGGGFKLKVLDYVFNRMPIFALQGSVAGMPLQCERSIQLYPSQRSLAEGVLHAIDNLDRLNQLQNAAFAACRDQFQWPTRGERLISAIASL